MIDIQKIAEQAGLVLAHDSEGHFTGVTDAAIIDHHPDSERERLYKAKRMAEILAPFAALIREAVAQELIAGSGEPEIEHWYFPNPMSAEYVKCVGYTADQLAGAVARERERCAQKVEAEAVCDNAAYYAAAIRSGE